MKRYEAGERDLNEEEKREIEYLASTGEITEPLPYDSFLDYMKRYEAGERGLTQEDEDEEYFASEGQHFHL